MLHARLLSAMIVVLALGACDQSRLGGIAAGAPQAAGTEISRGQFAGAAGHITKGSASVWRSADGWVVSLGRDFAFDGAPDPVVAFGREDRWVKDAKLGPLRSLSGAQTYPVPAAIDVTSYAEVLIWCEQFDVPLGVAKLRPR